MQQTDFLVIGSGIAGLTFAIKAAQEFPDKKILIITKAKADETNTKYAQGGIAGVTDFEKDSFEKHIDDTLIAGDGLCNGQVVEIVVKEGVDRIREIIDWGAQFDKEADGDYKLGREGGHSEFRILHHKDVTGKEMERALLEAVTRYKNIEIIKHCFVVDLLTQHHLGYLVTKSTPDIECYGVYVLNLATNRIEKIVSDITILCTGGNGQVYRSTTNPFIATGDGVAMVYRAKGRIENMEFIQFHPTALYEPGLRGQSFLITEAVRGDGGILRNKNGEAFMERYDPRKDLAPRDIVARAIDSEMKITGTEHVYLDVRHIPLDKFTEHFPNIYEKCKFIGIDVTQHLIPVAPAAHYSCGGIKTDEWGRTSVKSLYAAGECASTVGKTCGGRGGGTCAGDEYCNYTPAAMCGRADATGTCTKIFEGGCTADFNPVCGCDGMTYGNACGAGVAGVAIDHTGECAAKGDTCGGFAAFTCDGADEFCDYPAAAACGAADGSGTCKTKPQICPAISDPVCGCDGKPYGSPCNANAAGVSVLNKGACK